MNIVKKKKQKFDRKGVLIYGHKHIPFIEKEKEMIYINVGSISLPKDDAGPSYGIYKNKKFTLYKISGEVIDSIKLK